MIKQLRIHHLRNLHTLTVELTQHNWIVGKNGSGKTSLLEAVFLLSRGKSFRHHQPKHYISQGQDFCAIWANTTQGTLAIQKQLDHSKSLETTLLKINEQTAQGQSVLSYALPVLLLDPSGMAVLEEGSGSRRQLLDWLVFHVEHQFYEAWLAYQKLLKQRNHLLKSSKFRQGDHQSYAEMSAWDNQLAFYAKALHQYRLACVAQWQTAFMQMVSQLLPKYAQQLFLSYHAGFDETQDLAALLAQRLKADIEAGHTRVGAHRADITVLLQTPQGAVSAVNVLSRGEKKLLLSALKIAQLQVLCQKTGDNMPVVLIDDIDSELDLAATTTLLKTLLGLPCQLFISSLDTHKLGTMLSAYGDINVIDMHAYQP